MDDAGSNFDLPAGDWAMLRALLDEALGLPPDARPTWLDGLDDARFGQLKPRLRALLGHVESPRVESLLNTIPKVETDQFAPSASSACAVAGAGAEVGPYRLLQRLGEGGMATVWLAERLDMLQGRKVALKLPHSPLRRDGLAERLAREREILATLEHPLIARLYDAGVAGDGQPYLALEFVEGRRIDLHCEQRQLPVRERLGLFLQVARAVAHAHSHLVVHRDLKPSNILVTPDGQIRLLDFGIAKLLDDGDGAESELTQQIGRALTPGYASPEQLRGEPVGTASDIYSLGVVLHELLAGGPLHAPGAKGIGALIDAVLNEETVRPSAKVDDPRIRRQLQGDLDTIVLRALKNAPGDRYATVNALAEDIERHLDQRPVLARADSRAYRARRFVARNRVGVGLALAALLALTGGSAALAWQAHVAVQERKRAEDVKDFIAEILRDADPYEGTKGPVSVTDLLRRALDRVQEPSTWRDDTRVELLGVLGVSLKNLQDTNSAAKAFDQAVDLAQRSLGTEHRMALHARVERLGVYRFQGRSDELRQEVKLLLPLLRRRDADPADLVMTLQMQAHDAIDASHPDEAVKAATESLELARRHLGPTHADTANAATLVALGHEYAGRPAQAVQAAELALALQLGAHAKEPGHGDVISARVGLARALGEAGHLKRCIAEFDALMPGAIERFGARSVEVAFHKQNVVKYLLEAGELQRAEQAAADAERTFAAHPELSPHFYPVARMTLAATWLAARRAEAALPVFREVSPRLVELLGPRHPQAVRAEENWALAEAGIGQTSAASARLQRLVDGLPAEKVTPRLQRAQSVVQLLDGHAAEAVRLAQLALKSIEGPRAELERMRILPVLGMALLESGEARSAEAVLQEAISLMDRHQTGASPERGDAVRALALARRAGNVSAPPAMPLQSSRT